jgi:DNA-binding MarR family transcriptional regulator
MSPLPKRRPAEAADALITVAPLITRWIERLLAGAEQRLTLTQFLALRAIAAGVDSNVELAQQAGVSAPAVSQLVAGLVDAGWLDRREFAGDRRRLSLGLTSDGQGALSKADAMLTSRLSEILRALPAPEADAIAGALPAVNAMLAGAPPPRRPHPGPPPPPRRQSM